MDRFIKKWRGDAEVVRIERERENKPQSTESEVRILREYTENNLELVEILENPKVGEVRRQNQDLSGEEAGYTSTSSPSASVSCTPTGTGRKFQTYWMKKFSWLEHPSNKGGKTTCSFYSRAVNLKLPLPNDPHALRSKDAFVVKGFDTWSRAISAFNKQENNEFHQAAVRGLPNREKPSVHEHLSKDKKKQMNEARTALEKMFRGTGYQGHQENWI